MEVTRKRVLFIRLFIIVLVFAAAFPAGAGAVSYEEAYRPQFHYTPAANWMNDPNGLVYNEETEEYHMFYQCCATLEENQAEKYWGHAVSKDLIHWKELPVAIGPDALGSIWSGSAVIDRNNTSGFFDDSTPAGARMVAFFTYAGGDTTYGYEKQGLAYSTDNGLTWNKYEGNPIIGSVQDGVTVYDGGFRDPKVIWYEDSSYENGGIWLMVTAGGKARIFASPDLKNWTYHSTMRGRDGKEIESECPDFYPLSVSGAGAAQQKWIYSAAGRSYVVGDLTKDENGIFTFRAESDLQTLMKLPTDMYAAQTFFNDPKGRRIAIYWMIDLSSKEAHGLGEKAWDGVQSMPLEMKLETDGSGGYRMRAYPVEELAMLQGETPIFEAAGDAVSGDYEKLRSVSGELLYIELTYHPGTASRIDLNVRMGDAEKTTISYNVKTENLTLSRRDSGKFIKENVSTKLLPGPDGTVTMRVYVDASVIDIFTDTGDTTVHGLVFPDKNSVGVNLNVRGGEAVIQSMRIYEMASAWNTEYEGPSYTPAPTAGTPAEKPGERSGSRISITAAVVIIAAAAAIVCTAVGVLTSRAAKKKQKKDRKS